MKIIRARTSLKQKGLSQKLAKRLRKAPNCSGAAEAHVPRAVLAPSAAGARPDAALGRETVSCCCVFMDLGLDGDTLTGR